MFAEPAVYRGTPAEDECDAGRRPRRRGDLERGRGALPKALVIT